MALKAGTVGLDPKYVDKNGAPISQDKSVDAYTKAEADSKFATQTALADYVPETQLTANEKEFIFAYDNTSQKYGYKAGSDGAFTPFEEAGVTCYGWVKPANLSNLLNIIGIVSGKISTPTGGGGVYADGKNLYFDFVKLSLADNSSSTTIMNFEPSVDTTVLGGKTSPTLSYSCNFDTLEEAASNYYPTGQITGFSSGSLKASLGTAANKYFHVWGLIKIL